jgi:hypothetical protein
VAVARVVAHVAVWGHTMVLKADHILNLDWQLQQVKLFVSVLADQAVVIRNVVVFVDIQAGSCAVLVVQQ